MEWEHHKAENIMGFRDNAYRSLMTGTMSADASHDMARGDGRFHGKLPQDQVMRGKPAPCRLPSVMSLVGSSLH